MSHRRCKAPRTPAQPDPPRTGRTPPQRTGHNIHTSLLPCTGRARCTSPPHHTPRRTQAPRARPCIGRIQAP
eukprot:725705-Rhodomonas_salina.1